MISYNRIKEILSQKQLDAILVTDPYNRRYISGYTADTGYLFLTFDSAYLLTDFRYIEQAKKQCEPEIECMDITENGIYNKIKELCKKHECKKIGFENESILYSVYEKISTLNEFSEWISLDDTLTKMRMIKTEDEIQKIKRAEAIGDEAFSYILNEIKPGVTERQIALKLEYYMMNHGAQGLSFSTIVASGLNSSMPHAEVSDKKIETGDFITMDFGCVYEGYCSDMTRTVVVGKPSQKQKEIYDCVLKAQKIAFEIIREGVLCQKVDKEARDYIYSKGYEGCFGHGLGHSVGLFIHEEPRCSVKAQGSLKENQLMTVEPGIYIPGFGGVRIEDLVVVKKDGFENLTHSPKQLIEL